MDWTHPSNYNNRHTQIELEREQFYFVHVCNMLSTVLSPNGSTTKGSKLLVYPWNLLVSSIFAGSCRKRMEIW